MADFALPTFDKPRKWIKDAVQNGLTWEQIKCCKKNSDEELISFLQNQEDMNFWPSMSVDEWHELVELEKDAAEAALKIDFLKHKAIIINDDEDNAVTIPQSESSSWQLYRKKLLKDGFKKETVDEIEKATFRILKRLSVDTTQTEPVKGLVIGNVQSGKTANMAGLMAMAADWGWNMFIVLSGTIENLRIQTQTRLFNDLNQQGTIWWRSLEHLSKTVDISQKAQSLHFDENSKERYFTVCLKNSGRLSKLIQWAQADRNKMRQMKILVIDDEADQASINTRKVDTDERNRINALICALVNGKNEKNEPVDDKYKAMNYIGYTATPYANILNEVSPESLYPKNFISTLAVSNEYFGPQQIFGYEGDNVSFEGLDVVRLIDQNQLDIVKDIHDGYTYTKPEVLLDAICWFLCGVSAMRLWGYKKPVSMLVHTSQKTVHHMYLAEAIEKWLKSTDNEQIVSKCHAIWNAETARYTFEKFREQYPDYGIPDENIKDYPSFEEIEDGIRVILGDGVSNIELDSEGELTYHKGIHLCIDNCANNGISDDGMHVRLAYPESSKMPSPAPAFIVVGGATLSRGLTLEGLISTFFLRSVGQADSLMQMGRWFGYRKGYELLPRIWITEKTKEQFEFLAALDQELRDEIVYMEVNGRSPAHYGPKVKNSPKVSFIRITSKSKMQSAVPSTMDYSGASNQTILFDNKLDILEKNIQTTEQFLASLGDCWHDDGTNPHSDNAAIWRNVSFVRVKAFIESFSFQERMSVFNDTKPLLAWIEQMTANDKLGSWNIVVAGKKNNTNGTWTLPNGTVLNKVNRSRKVSQNEIDDSIINIGVLRDPSDLLADVDLGSIKDSKLRAEIAQYIKEGQSKAATAYRDKAGFETTPQLIIYRVDKNSTTKSTKGNRANLGAAEDLIGLCLYIPGGRIGTSYASTISVNLKNSLFDGDADLEDTDED